MKHILFLTWKDISHPRAGGAERVIMEYAKWLVADGYKVSWLGSWFSWAKEQEQIEWVDIYRKYSINTIYFFAYFWYKKFIKNNHVDIIIDEAGGIPLLSPLYEKKIPIYFFIHHIGDHEYETAFPFPVNKIFKRFVFWTFSLYKSLPTLTVSNSTSEELREKHGFTNISIVENATHLQPISDIDWNSKKKEIVFYGRLTRMKRTDHAIRAFWVLEKQFPDYTLSIIWNPQDELYAEELHKLVDELGLGKKVQFLGYSHKIVEEYLPRAEIMLVPSTKEWYGLIVLEWNCFGLPVIAYDVPWLRDSVRDGKNWVLVPDGDYTAMGEKLIELVNTNSIPLNEEDTGGVNLKNLSESSLQFIKEFGGWDERYKEFKEIILKR